MLKNLLILSLCIVSGKATGEFAVFNSPKSLLFQHNDPIQSHDIGEVVYTALGYPISGNSKWSGLSIVDPFNLPKEVYVVSLNGVEHSKISSAKKVYPVQGNTVEQSLNGVTAQLKSDGKSVCTASFEGLDDNKSSFGELKISPIAKTKYLDPDLHTADKQFLESCAYVNAIANNLPNTKKSCNFVYLSLSVDAVAKAHGANSDAVNEALDIFSNAVKNLNTAVKTASNDEALVLVVSNKADGNSRSKREAAPNDAKTLYNLAEYYNEDYPVIFNIILWFMVVFGFALLAICYAIGSMDPGRDSIIYRMTSTRMKKDN